MAVRGRLGHVSVYERLERGMAVLNERLGGLPGLREAKYVWDDLWYEEAHHSTALEGNSLALREVQALLLHGRAVGAKSLGDYNVVLGYADAARWVYGQAAPAGTRDTSQLVSVDEVRRLHHIAMTPAWDVAPHPDAWDAEGPGQFRCHDFRLFVGGKAPSSWPEIPTQLDRWVDDVRASGARIMSGLALGRPLPDELARLHNGFERVHPFLDGNGRVGRLLLNLILVRLGHPPVIVLKRQRDAYLSTIQRADVEDYAPLGKLIAKSMYYNLNRFIGPHVAGRGLGGGREVRQANAGDEHDDLSLAIPRIPHPRGATSEHKGAPEHKG